MTRIQVAELYAPVVADTTGFAKGLSGATSDAKEWAKEADKTFGKVGPGIKSSSKGLEGLAKAADIAKTALAGSAIVMAGKAAYNLGVLGAQSLRTKRAFDAISGGAFNAADNLDAMRRATRGAMSEQNMMATANQLLQMGLANNAEELEGVTEMAVTLGAAMGKEAGPAVEEFSLMLANQSIPRLDTFGISASKVRARILELQKATPGLSREMAFNTAVNEEGAKAMERLGDAADDELLANERLEASMADLKVMAGEALAPAMAEVAEAAATVTRAVIDAQREIDNLRDELGDAAVEAAQTEDVMGTLADASGILSGELDATGTNLYEAGSAMEALRARAVAMAEGVAEAVESGRSQVDGWSSSLFGTAEAGNVASESMYELSTSVNTVASSFGEMEFDDEQLWKMAAASGASLDELSTLAQTLGIATEAEIENTLEGYKLVEMFGEGELSAANLATGFDDLAASTRADEAAAVAARVETEALREEFLEGTRAVSGLQEGTDDATTSMLSFKDEIIPVNIETAEFGENISLVNDVLNQMAGEYTVVIHYEHTGTPPSALPGGGGGGGVPPPLQHGTPFWRGGLAILGDRGPELVALPRGSRVWSTDAPETQAAIGNSFGGDTYIINDRLAMALALEQNRHRRIQRIEGM